MKKALALLLVLCLVFGLVSCNKDEITNDTTETTEKTEATDSTAEKESAEETEAESESEDEKAPEAEETEADETEAEESESTATESEPETEAAESEPIVTDAATEAVTADHVHTYTNATCTEAAKCVCGATEGAALGHKFGNATCTSPKTCQVCGAVEGKALGHTFGNATCVSPKTCQMCGVTEGEPLGHKFGNATCVSPKVCQACGITEGEALGHNYGDSDTCVACGDVKETVAEETTPPVPEAPEVNDGFKNADYEGNEFTFLVINQNSGVKDYYGGNYIDSDAMTGNKISDAVAKRNLAVEERYNVQVNQMIVSDANPVDILTQYCMAGDFCYDAIYGWGYKLGACITKNLLGDFNNLTDADFTKEYWLPSTIDDLTVAGKQYLSQNEISMNGLGWANAVIYNKVIAENYNLEGYFGSLYDMVTSGNWTYDNYLKIAQSVRSDLDGDAAITRYDVFGIIVGNDLGYDALQNCGVYYAKEIEGVGLEASFYNEKTLSIIDKLSSVYSNDTYVKSYEDIWNQPGSSSEGFEDQWQYARSYFANDHALFLCGAAELTSEYAIANMESQYGILPAPKYDASQANYNAKIDSMASVFALPSSVRNDIGSWERTGVVLEYMAAKSHEILLPAYYETILRGQGDAEDRQMLDIIRTNARYDIAEIANITSISEVVQRMFANPATVASLYRQNAVKIDKELNDFYKAVMQLG